VADAIDISAVARVVDQASGPLGKIQGAIANAGKAASSATGFFSRMGSGVGGIFSRIGGAVAGIGQRIGRVASTIGSLIGPLAGIAGLGGIGGAVAAMNSYIDKAAVLGSASQRLGITVEGLQAFQFLTGDTEAANNALTKLQRTFTTISSGSKAGQKLVPLFRRMGVSMDAIKNGNMDEILPKIARSFQANVNPTTRARMALALFGKEGQKLIPMLAKGEAGLAEARAEMERLGIITQAETATARQAKLEMRRFGFAIEGVKNAIAAALLPAMLPIVVAMTNWIARNREFLAQAALPTLIASIAAAVLWLGKALVLALGPFGLLAAAAAAAAVLIYQNWDKIGPHFQDLLQGVGRVFQEAAEGIKSWAATTWDAIRQGFATGGLAGGAIAIFESLKSGATDAFAWITAHWAGIDWGTFGTAAGETLASAFNAPLAIGRWLLDEWAAIDWGPIGTAAGEALMGAWESALNIGRWIVEQFSNIDWPAVGNLIIDGLMAALEAGIDFLGWLSALDWAEVGRQAGQLIGQALIALLRATVDIGGWLIGLDWGMIVTQILTFFGTLTASMVKIGFEIIGGLIEGMIDAIPGLSAVVDKARSILGGIGRGIGRAGEFVGGLIPGLGGGETAQPTLPAGEFPVIGAAQPAPAGGGRLDVAQAAPSQPGLLQRAGAVQRQEVHSDITNSLKVGISPSPLFDTKIEQAIARAQTTGNGAVRNSTEVGQSMASAEAIA
jgi:hypothetical protein